MKKVLALILALVMVFAFVACDSEPVADEPVIEEPVVEEPNPVKDYFDAHEEEVLNALVSSFESSSGLTCKGELEVDGRGIIINVLIQGINDVPDDAKKQMQDAYDSMSSTFEDALTQMQSELPELESLVLNVCEEDGDVLAVIKTGK